MDRNNPVWREYLKADIRMQVDAGVAGVQLDESETPMGAMRYGGCFCRDCMAGFGAYLRRIAPGGDEELAGLDLDTFDYRSFLLERGFKAGDPPPGPPTFIGFDPRTFLRVLAADCARQGGFGRLPYSILAAPCIDLTEWLPRDLDKFLVELAPPTRRSVFANKAKGWTGPGVRPSQDSYIAMHLAVFLGLAGHG